MSDITQHSLEELEAKLIEHIQAEVEGRPHDEQDYRATRMAWCKAYKAKAAAEQQQEAVLLRMLRQVRLETAEQEADGSLSFSCGGSVGPA